MASPLDVLYILDRSFQTIGVVDEYYSVVWTDPFRGYGELELVLPPYESHISAMKVGNYVQCNCSDRLMVIGSIAIATEKGDVKLTVKGRSVEALLQQVTAEEYDFAEPVSVQAHLKKNLMANVGRVIPGFVFKEISASVAISATHAFECDYENLYDFTNRITGYVDLGWKITPNYTTKSFEFTLYTGTDRSYSQTDVPWVTFSPEYENIVSTNYFQSVLDSANTAHVLGPDELWEDYETTDEDGNPITAQRKIRDAVEFWVQSTPATGLDRREIFIDSSGTQWTYQEEGAEEQTVITQQDMIDMLTESALSTLAEKEAVEAFEGEVEAVRQFIYKRDFDIGDICQMKNEFGMEARIRVSEVMQSQDSSGYSLIPTFTQV